MRALAIVSILVLTATVAWGQAFTEDFEGAFPPAGWTVTDDAVPAVGCIWHNASFYGEGNYTGGAGDCAMADSDYCGSGTYLDTSLITHTFTVPGGSTLEFDANYSNISTAEFFDVDIDVGAGWLNLLSWKRLGHNPRKPRLI